MRVRSSLKACTDKNASGQVFNITHTFLSAVGKLLQYIHCKFAHTNVRCVVPGKVCIKPLTLTLATVQTICVHVQDNNR